MLHRCRRPQGWPGTPPSPFSPDRRGIAFASARKSGLFAKSAIPEAFHNIQFRVCPTGLRGMSVRTAISTALWAEPSNPLGRRVPGSSPLGVRKGGSPPLTRVGRREQCHPTGDSVLGLSPLFAGGGGAKQTRLKLAAPLLQVIRKPSSGSAAPDGQWLSAEDAHRKFSQCPNQSARFAGLPARNVPQGATVELSISEPGR